MRHRQQREGRWGRWGWGLGVGKPTPVFPSPIKTEIILWKHHLNDITTELFDADVLMKIPIGQKHFYTEKLTPIDFVFLPSSAAAFFPLSETIDVDKKFIHLQRSWGV